MDRLVIAAAIVAVAVVIAGVVRRRRPDAPTGHRRQLPAQLDRRDFARQDVDWLVVVFTSATCQSCADVVAKAAVLASDDVAVAEVEFGADRRLHERYAIDAVPALLIADAEGVVQRSFVGPVTATDLWAAMASVREAGD